jgi:hypothetical protein
MEDDDDEETETKRRVSSGPGMNGYSKSEGGEDLT